MFVNMLHGFSVDGAERRTQRSMTFDERLKRVAQRCHIGFRFYLDSGSDVVSHAFRRELLEEPESLLSIREWEAVGLRRFVDESGCRMRMYQLEAARRNLRDALTADEIRHRQEHAELRLDAVRQLNCDQ